MNISSLRNLTDDELLQECSAHDDPYIAELALRLNRALARLDALKQFEAMYGDLDEVEGLLREVA